MKHIIRAAAALSLAAALALGMTGCGHHSNSFTWQVQAVPDNLDPQLAASSANRIAVTHLYSGLYRLGPDGQPQPDCAQACDISADGLTYTFYLKEGLAYKTTKGKSTDYAVTAEDFVFGLQRVFLPQTKSPYAAELSNIRGSQAVLAGSDPDQLAVRALDDLTLEIRLVSPDDEFLRKLCLPGAMPCDREFFQSSGGSYGLSRGTTLSNGSFYLYSWTESGLFLRRTPQGSRVDNLRLVLPSQDDPGQDPQDLLPEQLVLGGKCSAALSDRTLADLDARELNQLPYTATTWGLLFRCDSKEFSNRDLRAALAQTARQASLTHAPKCTPASGLLPPAMNALPSEFPTLGDPQQLFRQGLEETGLSSLTGLTVLVPAGASQMFAPLNQEWQRQLQVFFNLKEVPLTTLRSLVSGELTAAEQASLEKKHGRWVMALIPLESPSADPARFLAQFDDRLGNWQNEAFHAQLDDAFQLPGGPARQQAIARAEQMLMQECVAVPLFYQDKALLVEPGVQDLVFDPFGPLLDLTFASLK